MTDIHAHILPGVDDGSPDMATSLQMLEMAASSGVRTIAATPHCSIPGELDNFASPALERAFHELQREKERAEIPIRIVRGMEVFATAELPSQIRERRLWTLAGSRYLLMEFAFGEDPAFAARILNEVKRTGLIPVIAHPERYYFVQDDPQIAYKWCVGGAALQLNKGSIIGRFGRDVQVTAIALLRHHLAAAVASDAHGVTQRTTDLREARAFLDLEYGEETSELLLSVNPERILKGQLLYGYEPQPF